MEPSSRMIVGLAVTLVLSACGSPGGSTSPAATPSLTASESRSAPPRGCDAGEAEAPDNAVLLYFPCGSLREMAAVVRTIPETGDERVRRVLQRYLAGPSAEERESGFSSMLAPGDVEIVDAVPGRVVLDFPTEVDNVSTSSGSRTVLDGLRRTIIGLNGIEEIELRLRNDCAAFFEWIQIGPTCHVLTADGLVSVAPTAEAVQEVACEHSSGAYRVILPEGWWTNPEFEDPELGPVAACRFFAPTDFDVTTGDRERPHPAGTAIWLDHLDSSCVGYINPILTSRATTVAGYPATVSELAFGKEETNPPFTYEYLVSLTPDIDCESGGRYLLAFTRRDVPGEYEQNKAVLDQMMQTIEVRNP